MVRPIFFPHNIGSNGCKQLSKRLSDLRAKRVRFDGKYRHKYDNHRIINWGNCTLPDWYNEYYSLNWLNHPISVSQASNKLSCLTILKNNNINVPEFTNSRSIVADWVYIHGKTVFARELLNSSQGNGIKIINHISEVENAPLYTQYIQPRGEYRVHVFNGEVIDYQKKRKVTGEESNDYIRNFHNGWVYCRNNLHNIMDNEDIAIKAIQALDLDFGAVDIIRTDNNVSYVLEINTAPGLEGTTITSYENAIRKYLSDNN